MIWLLLLLLLGPDAIDLKLEQLELRAEARFGACMGGPGKAAFEFCTIRYDWDEDGDVDLGDWAAMTSHRVHLPRE